MAWTKDGNAVCDSCNAVKLLDYDRATAVQQLLASPWHYASGATHGGSAFEVIACPDCAHGERKRMRKEALVQTEQLPLDWEQWRKDAPGQGFQSR